MSTMEKATLLAPDISCGHCQQHISADLGKLAGVGKVSSSLETKVVEVEYDPSQVSLDSIKSTLDKAGYPAQDVAV